ncbi:MAG: NAD(P)/FAD-dependent oxidoreductase [Dehalococcoidales bacterium]|nr:NAD(P)/FAD-dependent oxidoreductase [Dehalococcoidales bacterium]
MFDYDAVIIGGGPAGLTAGLYLARAGRRTLLVDRDAPGGYLKNIALVENYPGFPEGISGAELARRMVEQSQKYGLRFETAEVTGIEVFSGTRFVSCGAGGGFTTAVVIIAGGARNKKLGVPGETELSGKGVFECALCDGGAYAGRVVAVCGGGDSGVTEALYLAKIASRVIVIEAMPRLTATAILQERLLSQPNVEVRCGARVTGITGSGKVEAIVLSYGDRTETVAVDGVLVHIGLEANTSYLEGVIPLDKEGQVIVSGTMETEVPFVLAAGDIRSGSPRQITAAVRDGTIAAISALRLLEREG